MKAISFNILILFYCSQLFASEFPKDSLAGVEIEVGHRTLAHIVHLFAFTEILNQVFDESISYQTTEDKENYILTYNREHFGERVFDDYLKSNPNALFELPKGLQAKLTEGLSIQQQDIERADWRVQSTVPQSLILPDKLQKPSSDIYIEEQTEVSEKSPELEDLVTRREINQNDWATVRYRWRQLDYETKAQLVPIEKWPAMVKAHWILDEVLFSRIGLIATRQSVKYKNPQYSLAGVIRDDLSDELKAFLNRFAFYYDSQGVFEIVHQDPVESKLQLSTDLQRWKRLLGNEVSKYFASPLDYFALQKVNEVEQSWGSVHLHFSHKGANLRDLVPLLNLRLAVKKMRAGIFSDYEASMKFEEMPDYFYDEMLYNLEGGHVREIKGDLGHIEVATLLDSIDDEIEFYTRVLNDPQKAKLELKNWLRENMTVEILTRMLDSDIFRNIRPRIDLTHARRAHLLAAIEAQEIKSEADKKFVNELLFGNPIRVYGTDIHPLQGLVGDCESSLRRRKTASL